MGSTDLVRAQYSGYDFDTQSDDLRSRLQVKFATDYNDFATSALGIMLLDSVAFGLDTLSFYLDRRATDTYLATARTRKSVARLTRQLGYKMRAAVASSVDLNVTIPSPGFNVTLPQRFQFKGPNSLIFESAQPVTWQANDVARLKAVPCYEGETVTERFVSDGTANQVFYLRRVPDQKYVVAGSVTVLVNGASFNESEFIDFESTDQFEAGYNDDPPTIRFGDGHGAGNIPASGASIVVTYVASRGAAGLVSGGTITSSVSPLVVAFQTVKMTIANPLGSVGGSDLEDLEHAKIYGPRVYKSRNVAVTGDDYEALAGSFASPLFGRVAAAQAIAARSASDDTALTDQLAVITNSSDDALPYAGGVVQLTGQALSVATDGTITGIGTKFASELHQGSYVQFGDGTAGTTTAPGFRRVTTPTGSITDTTVVISPGPAAAITTPNVIYRSGSEIVDAQGKLRVISEQAASIVDPVSASSGALKDIATNTTAIRADVASTIPAKVLEARGFLTDGTNAAASITTTADYALSTSAWGGVTSIPTSTATTPVYGSTSPDGDLTYTPKQYNVTIAHVVSGSTNFVAVSGKDITLTVAAATTAQTAAGVVNGSPAAAALVSVVAGGTGLGVLANRAQAPVPVNGLTSPTKTDLTNWLNSIKSLSSTLNLKLSSTSSDLDAISNAAADANAKVGVIGVAATSGLLDTARTASNQINSIVGDTSTVDSALIANPGTTLMGNLSTVQGSVVTTYSTVKAACDAIYNHVDQMLSRDCQANLVSVPILATDKAGFYVEPSKGLIRALQEYLDARKEVTQTVAVTSGGDSLVKVRIEARVGVKASYSEAVTGTAVTTALEGLLRNRKFGDDLYLADLYNAVDTIAGVAFSNIVITSASTAVPDAATHIDSDGNLIVGVAKVITKDPAAGAVTVTTETTTTG